MKACIQFPDVVDKLLPQTTEQHFLQIVSEDTANNPSYQGENALMMLVSKKQDQMILKMFERFHEIKLSPQSLGAILKATYRAHSNYKNYNAFMLAIVTPKNETIYTFFEVLDTVNLDDLASLKRSLLGKRDYLLCPH